MAGILNRITSLWRGATSTRSYEAAAGGRRWSNQPTIGNSAAALQGARATVAHRARSVVVNDPLANSGVEAWVSALVATGIKSQSSHPDPDVKATLNLSFEEWSNLADMDGLTDWYGMQAIAARRMVVDGEAFILMLSTPDGLRLRLLDADQIVSDLTYALPTGRVEAGIEFNERGQRIAYHVRRDHPGQWPALRVETVRIPAEDMIHLFKQEVPGQLRGISWLAPVLLRLSDLGAWRDAQIVRAKVAALYTGFLTSGPEGVGELQPNGTAQANLEPGAINITDPGQEITFSDPPKVGEDMISFAKLTEHEVAAGLGIPYSVLTGDLSAANYSSTRAGLVEWRRRVEMIQHSTLVFMALRRIYARWAMLEVMSGRVASLVPPAQAAKFITPKFAWVDPKKDAEAEILLVNSGLQSRRASLASRGLDIEAVDQEIADDNARAKTLGLDFSPRPANDNTPPAAEDAA